MWRAVALAALAFTLIGCASLRRAVPGRDRAEVEAELLQAARAGSAERVRVALAAGARASAGRAGGVTPLHAAAAAGSEEAVNLLLSAGAVVDARTATGWTPLVVAATEGHTGVVRLLLAAGADPQVRDPETFRTVLGAIAARGDADLTALLVAAAGSASAAVPSEASSAVAWSSEPPRVDATNESAPSPAVPWSLQPAAALAIGAEEPEPAPAPGAAAVPSPPVAPAAVGAEPVGTPLGRAAEDGDLDLLELFLAVGAEVDAADTQGVTPLMRAVTAGRLAVVRRLLDAGADPAARDSHGRDVLSRAHDEALRSALLERAPQRP